MYGRREVSPICQRSGDIRDGSTVAACPVVRHAQLLTAKIA
jgi:hypothetical protein